MRKTVASFLASGDIDGLLAAHRATFGDARMDDNGSGGSGDGGQGGNGGTGGTGGGTGGAGGGNDARFTQADMNATVARETAAAKQKAEQDIAAALGVTIDEAKQIIAARRAADDQNKTEAQRAADAWKTAQAGAEEIKRAADQERHDAKVERELQRAGFDITNATLLPAAMAAVAPHVQLGADEAAVKAAVEKVKTEAPQLFGSTSNGGGGGQHSDAGGQNRNNNQGGGEFGGKGKAEAQRRWGNQQQQSA